MLLFAFLIPVFIFALGAGLDFGWYYLNVSRLQNAADAAVVAGAQKLLDDDNFSNYKGVKLVAQYPADDSNKSDINTTVGDALAKEYAAKNLGTENDDGTINDGYDRGGNSTITLEPSLYKDENENFY